MLNVSAVCEFWVVVMGNALLFILGPYCSFILQGMV